MTYQCLHPCPLTPTRLGHHLPAKDLFAEGPEPLDGVELTGVNGIVNQHTILFDHEINNLRRSVHWEVVDEHVELAPASMPLDLFYHLDEAVGLDASSMCNQGHDRPLHVDGSCNCN